MDEEALLLISETCLMEHAGLRKINFYRLFPAAYYGKPQWYGLHEIRSNIATS